MQIKTPVIFRNQGWKGEGVIDIPPIVANRLQNPPELFLEIGTSGLPILGQMDTVVVGSGDLQVEWKGFLASTNGRVQLSGSPTIKENQQ